MTARACRCTAVGGGPVFGPADQENWDRPILVVAAGADSITPEHEIILAEAGFLRECRRLCAVPDQGHDGESDAKGKDPQLHIQSRLMRKS